MSSRSLVFSHEHCSIEDGRAVAPEILFVLGAKSGPNCQSRNVMNDPMSLTTFINLIW